ncbi:MAG TPA: protein kinase [Gemmatimonadaceae bacterium]|nr:protein kinase [Gemmatimonadaceae bacterium]
MTAASGQGPDPLRDQLQAALGAAYRIEGELTGGGMSRVFVARELGLGRRVVVKTLSPDSAAAVSTERFRREIRLAASLQQANIVPVLAAGEADGLPYYMMPFVDGESLRAHLAARGVLSIREAVSVLRDVARALAFAHERGVVHRDIKPENILLSGSTAVVTDFGIAKALADAAGVGQRPERAESAKDLYTLTQLGAAIGTPAYMSPEQASADPGVDHRADIYALGVIAYELLTGAPPFTGRSPRALLVAHIAEEPAEITGRRGDVPRELAAFVMRCLEKEPERRPQSGREVLHALESVSTMTGETVPLPRPAERPKPSVAVLPFANLGASADDEYFSEGITEDIIAQLSQIASLKVISRTSVMRYKGTTKGTREIAAELSVTHVVEGTVRRASNRLRIVAQLIDAASDAHLWARTFDRDLTDVFAIQTEVAEQVAGALRARLSPEERARAARRPTGDSEAYNLFLLGRHHYYRASPDSVAQAIACFERAIARDPRFARAYAMLAKTYCWHVGGYFGVRPRETAAKAIAYAARALEIDPDVAEAHVALGWVEGTHRYDWAGARARYERGLALNPNSELAHLMYGFHLLMEGRPEEALDASYRAVELDPASPETRGTGALISHIARRFDDAMGALESAEAQFPDDFFLAWMRALVTVPAGRAAESVPVLRRMRERVPVTLSSINLAWALAVEGATGEARELLREVHAREATEYVWPPGVAWTYAALGDADRAFAYLERGYEDGVPWMGFIACAPAFDPLRGDPRLESLVRRIGAVPPPLPPAAGLPRGTEARAGIRAR